MLIKNMIKIFILGIIFCFFIIAGCSDKNDFQNESHPDSWMDVNSSDFHGHVTLVNGDDHCKRCHGDDLNGGDVEISCVDCHQHENACSSCHGGKDNLTGAPPFGLHGEIDDTTLAVGAHTAHVESGEIAAALNCEVCHIMPTTMMDSAHFNFVLIDSILILDSIAEINWSGIAGEDADWGRSDRKCNNTYCHGNFSGGDSLNSPVWTDANQAECGSCHDAGTDPASLLWHHEFHISTAGLNCSDCHAGVVDSLLNITDISLHVNGLVDTLVNDISLCSSCHGSGSASCTGCHGGTDNLSGAPPFGLHSETATTERAVGAHTAHLSDSDITDAFECSSCHLVPNFLSDEGHLGDDSIAEVSWSFLAGEQTIWDRDIQTCSNSYCHGNFTGGYDSNSPRWNQENQAECGSCHNVGSRPSDLGWKHEFHITSAGLDCSNCHSTVIDSNLVITDITLHVNGNVDTLTSDTTLCVSCHSDGALSCTGCHGGDLNDTGAPPKGLSGETATTDLAVGAHTAHVSGGSIANAMTCAACHLEPDNIASPGHLDPDSIAELTWGDISGDQSIWNRSNAKCSNVYCHGNFTGGNNANAPIWTGTDQASCGSCHNVDNNYANLKWEHQLHIEIGGLACDDCHSSVVNTSLQIINTSLHVNGSVDLLTKDQAKCDVCHKPGAVLCTMCHGGIDNQSGAPPTSLTGETLPSHISVGAHSSHIDGNVLSDGVECNDCHEVPVAVLEAGHIDADSIAELSFNGISGFQSDWDRVSESCSDTYCHGNFNGGNSSNSPSWTGLNQAECGSCHNDGSQPDELKWKHKYHITDLNFECVDCHANVVDLDNNIIGFDLHINGVADTLANNPAACNACHGPVGVTCTFCHGGTDNITGAPPQGLDDEVATSELAVGAHTIHLDGGSKSHSFECSTCHLVPVVALDLSEAHYMEVEPDDIAEIIWGGLSGENANWDRNDSTCSGTYCHGDFRGGNQANSPNWTGGSVEGQCGSCHAFTIENSNLLLDKHEKHVKDEDIECYQCHNLTVDQNLIIIGHRYHVDGINTVSFSSEEGSFDGAGCSGVISCHGDNESKDW